MRDVIVDCAVYRDGRRTDCPADLSGVLREARGAGDAFVWIGLHEPAEEEFGRVAEEFGLHPLAVEDALKAHQRPKLEVYEDSLFLVLKPVRYEERDGTVTTGELMVFVGEAFVVTVRHGTADPLGTVRDRLEQTPEVLRQGPTAVVYAVTDTVVDRYLEVAEDLRTDMEALETEVFSPDRGTSGRTARRIYAFKRRLLEFRRAAGPLVEPVNRLAGAGVPFVHAGSQPFFRDVGDHLARVEEQTDALDRLLSDVLAAHLAQMGVRQNDDMRKISAWAAMVAVPTMVAGVYGMNFSHMPELRQSWGYPVAVAVMVGTVFALYRFFRRRGWL
ncbi:magnesium/cobalt transporter CorA [Streptomyces pactum]|uniref:Magnesium transport protein CorA n=1 Tax=Streptomyces pactum TaxID=68249 RepID=A0ABS0NFW4_9ACTN|nr:magnesium/cobalt transporter CorA [Streptomyces pactum]MBH5334077.1 magnesium/cobalt transporter CorA [Streptomyces pactum]